MRDTMRIPVNREEMRHLLRAERARELLLRLLDDCENTMQAGWRPSDCLALGAMVRATRAAVAVSERDGALPGQGG